MKKGLLFALLAAILILSGCTDILHNTVASKLIFVFKNMPVKDGDYSIPGSFKDNSWNNGTHVTTFTGGAGTFTDVGQTLVISDTLTFSLVQKDTWTRSWFKAGTCEGNADDYGAKRNFEVKGISIDGTTHTITVDGSTNPITLKLD